MNIEKFKLAIDNISDIVVHQYFRDNEKKYKSSVQLLHDKIDNYPDPSVHQPISVSPFKNYISFLPYCLNEPNLIGSILFLNLAEPAFLISDINVFSDSNNIKWDKKPTIESIATADQLFQNARQRLTQILKSPKINKKDTDEILKLIEPLSGAKQYKDIQHIYWMLYCEIRFTLQLLKPDKDFKVSFEFDKAWLDLRENDVPLLKILSQTSIEDYLEPDFEETTKEQIRTTYIKAEKQIPKPKIQNKISDSATTSLLGHVGGLRWQDISIIPNSLETVIIKAPDYEKEHHYSEFGMKDERKKGQPNLSWRILLMFAGNHGILSYNDFLERDYKKDPKKAVSVLQQKLMTLFGLKDKPIEKYEKGIGYKTKYYTRSELARSYMGSEEQEEDILSILGE